MRAARAGAIAAMLAAVSLAGCGNGDDREDRFAQIPKRTVKAPANQTAPRWEPVASLRGDGATTETVDVSDRALQWRLRWRCQSRKFEVAVTPRPQAGSPRTQDRCPGRGSVTFASTGRQRLEIQAAAPWRMSVEQEVRTPLHEPPLAAMRSTRPIARGRFYPIEIEGSGTAALYRLPNGSLVLRMEDFRTEPNPSLVVWLSEAIAPKTTKKAFAAPHTELRGLKSTIGDQNYVAAETLDPRRVRSVVVWNKPSRIAYAAASLKR